VTEPPISGSHRTEPRDDGDDVDGVVLYDPTPRGPFPSLEPEPDRRGGRTLIAILLLASVALGGYQLFGRSGPADADDPSVPAMVPSGLGGAEAALVPVGTATKSGQAGGAVSLEVRARGAAGEPIADSLVEFVVASGSVEIEPASARTDSVGVARTTVLLPTTVSGHVVVAHLFGSDLETRFSVQALPGPPARVAATGGSGQEAEVTSLLPERASVLVTDSNGNPVPGVEILFEAGAGGSAAPSRVRTDSSGVASAMWRLGIDIGVQELRAMVRTTGSSVTFQANALGLPAAIEGAPRMLERAPVSVAPRELLVGGSFVCRLSDGRTQCRGADDQGQTAGAGVAGLVALTGGVSHACGLTSSGEASCWGDNDGGQLGDGSRTDRRSAVPVRTETRFNSLTAGLTHTCGVAGGSIAVCWGQNLSGQLGDGTRTDARFPRAVGGGILFRTLVAGWNHTCGITNDGNAFCWGPNGEGQLGDGTRQDRLSPTLVSGNMDALTAGTNHTCGLSDGQVLCWGSNRFGQLGDGTTETRDTPTRVTGLPSRATQLTAGAVHTCALATDGTAYCWGQNLRGQLGIGSNENQSSPTRVTGGLRFRTLEAGGAVTCGITTEGAEYCWGMNQDGQIGDGTRENRPSPVRVSG
jgi:alpha-tubulin suppressor-like RCC1 family protein